MSEVVEQHSSDSSDNEVVETIQEVEEKVEEIIEEKVEEKVEEVKSVVSDIKKEVETASSSKQTTETCGGCPYSLSGKNSICGSLCDICSVIKKNPLFETGKAIVLWTDLIQTGLLFIIVNLVFFLTCCLKYNSLSLLGYVGFVVTGVSILFRLGSDVLVKYTQGITLDNAITDQLKTLTFNVNESTIEKQAKNIGELVNTVLRVLVDVFSVRSLYLSGQFLVLFYVIGSVGKCVSLNTLLYVSFLVLFIVPRVYLEKKDIIDPQINKAREIGKELLNKLHSFIPVSSSKKNN